MLPPSDDVSSKEERLLQAITGYGRVAVAFSAGVDSTVVAKASAQALGERTVAVTAVSRSLPAQEVEAAEQLAKQIGIEHRIVHTDEFDDDDYVRNNPRRCYHCKSILYQRIADLQPELQFDVIVNGSNLDDQSDYRPGEQAALEFDVRSPLVEAGLTKADVRLLARHWALPIWDKPATPCLSSRIAYGLPVTAERIERVDRAERFLRETLGLREFRVRHEMNELARIEVPGGDVARLAEETTRQEIVETFKSIGFRYVTIDLEGFRSGSMNAESVKNKG